MEPRGQSLWIIVLSFFIAFLLAIVPFPEWALSYRPQWVVMVMMYWAMALPYRVGIGYAWVVGLTTDVVEGSMMGLNAMALTVVVYLTLSLHQRFRMFSAIQQSGLVLALVGVYMIMVHWMKIATNQTVSSNLFFLLGAVSSAFLWPWVYVSLRQLHHGFSVR